MLKFVPQWLQVPVITTILDILKQAIPERVSSLLDDSHIVKDQFKAKILSANSPHALFEVHISDIIWKDISIKKAFMLGEIMSIPQEVHDLYPSEMEVWWKITGIALSSNESTSTNARWESKKTERKQVSFTYISPEWKTFECRDVSPEVFGSIFKRCFHLSKHLTVDFTNRN